MNFSFKVPADPHNWELAGKISQGNAVSLHVRRGDYAVNPFTLATHRLCLTDYCQEAIRYIANRVVQPVFFFPDDIASSKKI